MVKSSSLRRTSAIFFGVTLAGSAQAISYNITDLGTLGYVSSWGNDVNSNGQVTGYSYIDSASTKRAFLYDGTAMRSIGTLAGGTDSYAYGINDNSHITGFSEVNNGGYITEHAFLYDGTAMHDLGTLGGLHSYGYDINNAGQVAGWSSTGTSTHAFLYDGAIMRDLGTLGGYTSIGRALNDNGYVVGESLDYSRNSHAFVHDGTSMSDLGTLGGRNSAARGINNKGQIVGNSEIAGNSTKHAFLYDGTTMIDINPFDAASSFGLDINNNGQAVGYYRTIDGGFGSFIYDDGELLDLCALIDCLGAGWLRLTTANAINDNGDITGYGVIDGYTHAFLITTSHVPLPATFWLFGSGLIGLIGVALRKFRLNHGDHDQILNLG